MVSVAVFVLCFAYLANAIYGALNGYVQESGKSEICIQCHD